MSKSTLAVVSLATLAKGELEELFDLEVQKVVANIHDLGTILKKDRTVSIDVTFTPLGDDRESIAIETSVSSKLAGRIPVREPAYLGQDSDGKLVASTRDPRQLSLIDTDPAVRPISTPKEAQSQK